MPDSPTLAAMVSLSTSQPMSKTKESKLTPPASPERVQARDGGQA